MNFVSLFAQSSYYSQDISAADSAAYAGAAMVFMVIAFVIVAIAYIVTALLLGRIFKKAGVESWKAWVPIYNNWTLLELGGQKGYWAVLAFIPIINIASVIFMFIAMYHIGLGFGKESIFVLLAILLPLVWYIWLAFDSSVWKDSHQLSSDPSYAKSDPSTLVDPSK